MQNVSILFRKYVIVLENIQNTNFYQPQWRLAQANLF